MHVCTQLHVYSHVNTLRFKVLQFGVFATLQTWSGPWLGVLAACSDHKDRDRHMCAKFSFLVGFVFQSFAVLGICKTARPVFKPVDTFWLPARLKTAWMRRVCKFLGFGTRERQK